LEKAEELEPEPNVSTQHSTTQHKHTNETLEQDDSKTCLAD